MKLSQLFSPWVALDGADCELDGVSNDSRLVKSGELFLAYPGAAADGRLFIDKAVQAGAAAIAYEPSDFPATITLPASIPCVALPDLSDRLSEIAERFYNYPGKSLTITGVTGTNGKTTIAYQLAQAHNILGRYAAYIGTIGQGEVNQLKPLENTTPDALCLQKLLFQYQRQGVKQVCMEVSSHALSQNRVAGIAFNQALFTNLTLDHLDFHHTMQEYAAAKARLFAVESLQWAILNEDDDFHTQMRQALPPHVQTITYGLHKACDVKALEWSMDIHGTSMRVRTPWGEYQLTIKALGEFNIYNSLAIFASLLASGYPPEQVVPVMAQLKPAPGRMEIVSKSPYVLVDYAHTPDALENALRTLKQLKKGRLWVIFGCGGDRDISKRPVMGKVADEHADVIVITSDNPRTEQPERILDDIVQGLREPARATKIVNREEAIMYALNRADKDDVLLIAGKGHEAYQQIGKEKHAFSDQEVVRRFSAGSSF